MQETQAGYTPDPDELELLVNEEDTISGQLPKRTKAMICEQIYQMVDMCKDVINEATGLDNPKIVRISIQGLQVIEYNLELKPVQGVFVNLPLYNCYIIYKSIRKWLTKLYSERVAVWKEIEENMAKTLYDNNT